MNILCLDCYYTGKGKTPGSFLIEVFLWFLFFPIGLIYTIYRYKKKNKVCPDCGSKETIPSNSKRAKMQLEKENHVRELAR